jgi:hypothetical protein
VNEQKVRLVPHTHASAGWNLALEHALYELSFARLRTKGWFEPVVRTYSFQNNSVVLGYKQPISEIDLQYCVDNSIDVTMRQTGGGSVFLNPSDIQYAYLMPVAYSADLLGVINRGLHTGIKDEGLFPMLLEVNGQRVIRMPDSGRDKSFVFDAQRRGLCKDPFGDGYKHILWHHGTILVSRQGYNHMPVALKASPRITRIINEGNYWLSGAAVFRRSSLLHTLSAQLPFSLGRAYVQDFTAEELALAKTLYDALYSDPRSFSDGNKPYGICYIPDTEELPESAYDMEKYAVKD